MIIRYKLLVPKYIKGRHARLKPTRHVVDDDVGCWGQELKKKKKERADEKNMMRGDLKRIPGKNICEKQSQQRKCSSEGVSECISKRHEMERIRGDEETSSSSSSMRIYHNLFQILSIHKHYFFLFPSFLRSTRRWWAKEPNALFANHWLEKREKKNIMNGKGEREKKSQEREEKRSEGKVVVTRLHLTSSLLSVVRRRVFIFPPNDDDVDDDSWGRKSGKVLFFQTQKIYRIVWCKKNEICSFSRHIFSFFLKLLFWFIPHIVSSVDFEGVCSERKQSTRWWWRLKWKTQKQMVQEGRQREEEQSHDWQMRMGIRKCG